MDDLVISCKNTQEAYCIYVKALERMKEGGFSLRKWKTNDKMLESRIQQKESESGEIKTDEQSYAKETLGNQDSVRGRTKVLGLMWDNDSDEIEFDLAKTGRQIESKSRPTKRTILSVLASIFDPLGLVSPIAVAIKILFQDMCIEKLGWDEPLPEDKSVRWRTWLINLLDTVSIVIPGCMLNKVKGNVISYELHGFADASKRAYCAMIYLVCETSEGFYTTLLSVKTRVAPLKLSAYHGWN